MKCSSNLLSEYNIVFNTVKDTIDGLHWIKIKLTGISLCPYEAFACCDSLACFCICKCDTISEWVTINFVSCKGKLELLSFIICLCHNPDMVDVLNAELGRINGVRVPSVIFRRRSGNEHWFDELCRATFQHKQADYHRWRSLRTPANWVLVIGSQLEANACQANAHARYNARSREELVSASSIKNLWNTLKGLVLVVGSSIPSLQSDRGVLVSDQTGKAALLSTFFDGKQSRDVVDCPASCHCRFCLCSLAFRSCEV